MQAVLTIYVMLFIVETLTDQRIDAEEKKSMLLVYVTSEKCLLVKH